MIFGWQQQAYDAVGVTLTRLVTGAPGNRENISNPVIDDLADKLLYESDPIQVRNLVTQIRASMQIKSTGLLMQLLHSPLAQLCSHG